MCLVNDAFSWFASQHSVGDLVYGRVTHFESGNAAVLIDDDLHGWCAPSEGTTAGGASSQVLTIGSEHWVKVIEIDPRAERVWLSVRRAEEGGNVSYYEALYPPEDWP